MRICFFGASSCKERDYNHAVEDLCERLGREGHELVFGGFDCGLMGSAARGFSKAEAGITGVITSKILEAKEVYNGCTNVIESKNLSERKKIMMDMSDVFMAVPGGIGTFDELFSVLAQKQVGEIEKEIIIFDIDGYYDSMIRLISEKRKSGFVYMEPEDLFMCSDNIDEVSRYIHECEKKQQCGKVSSK